MPVYVKRTSDIYIGNWTTIQMRASVGHQLDNNIPLDDLGGPGPYLVHEKGIWKYPQQDDCGAFLLPVDIKMPVRLISVLADLGAITDWSLIIGGNADNLSGTPYLAADAADYREGTVTVETGTTRYISSNYNIVANGTTGLLFPGQRIYMTTVAGTAPLVRITLALAYDMK